MVQAAHRYEPRNHIAAIRPQFIHRPTRLRVRRGMAALYLSAVASSVVALASGSTRVASAASVALWLSVVLILSFRRTSYPRPWNGCGYRW